MRRRWVRWAVAVPLLVLTAVIGLWRLSPTDPASLIRPGMTLEEVEQALDRPADMGPALPVGTNRPTSDPFSFGWHLEYDPDRILLVEFTAYAKVGGRETAVATGRVTTSPPRDGLFARLRDWLGW
jgi:hypothetical protein